MTESLHRIAVAATVPDITAILEDQDGAVDLSNASNVKFSARFEGKTRIDNSSATIVTASSGKVKFSPSTSDFTIPGLWIGWFTVNWPSSEVEHFPAFGIEVTPT